MTNTKKPQEVLLVRSGLTGAVYAVTKWKDLGSGQIEAIEKFDVTKQFEKLVNESD